MLLWNADTFNLKISLLFHAVLQRLLLGSMKNNKKPLRVFFSVNGNYLSLPPILGIGENKVKGGCWQ